MAQLRTFGCRAYAHIPKTQRSKLDRRAEAGVMVGYSYQSKAWRIFIPESRRIIESRDVRFIENGFPYQSQQNKPQPDLVTLSLSSEDKGKTSQQEESAENNLQLRRSTRQRKTPQNLGQFTTDASDESRTIREALQRSDADQWRKAAEHELQSLREHDAWDLVPLPPGKKAIGSRWELKIKRNVDGTVERYRARSVHIILAVAAANSWPIHQVDVSTAYLNGTVKEELYIRQPPEFEQGDLVCRLKRSLYGLKQAAHEWQREIKQRLISIGLNPTRADEGIYVLKEGHDVVIVTLYVDDLIITANTEKLIAWFKGELEKAYKIRDLGEVSLYLGLNVTYDSKEKLLQISQSHFAQEILERYRMNLAKPATTPMELNQQITPATDDDIINNVPYRSAIGAVQYLANMTRPDLSYAANRLSSFNEKHNNERWLMVKRILRYIKGTKDLKLTFQGDSLRLVGYADADFASDKYNRRSTSGY
ncbi:uncharacterized protein VTP21DRAFT_5341, partial [Calcarisporiella thermophila]|uniref:uncharacterized protein n=1 Tax=Calcarisporiella thermophila TaxID=911321 RepID=UPI003742F4E3